MKIIVNKTFDETVSSGSHRCSDGHYRESNYTQSVNVYSDSGKFSITVAEKICNFIKSKTSSDTDKVWDWSYEGASTEEYNSQFTKELFSLLENENIELSNNPKECPILMNPIALKLSDSHKLIISELKVKQSEIQKRFQNETSKCKAEIAHKAFYLNDGMYHLNEMMHDFNEFPLDIARQKNDVEFLVYLIQNGAKAVQDYYAFAGWLCKVGKFEFLDLFVDLSKLKLLRTGDPYHANELKNYWMTECILYYTIANNRLDLFKKFGEDRFEKKISEIHFVEDNNLRAGTPISIGRIAVKHSNIETIKELYGKFSFFEPIHSGWSSYKHILDVHCFRDTETTSFFVAKMMVDSIFGLLYWGKNEILQGLIESNNINFSNIYLSSLREFFKPENNSIFEFLASVNSFSLIKLLPRTNNCEFVPYIYRDRWATIYPSGNSVLESCLIQNNFILFSKMFSVCIEKESIESYDACRLLFMVYKYNESQEVEDSLPLLLKFISPTDLRMLLGVACILENKRLIDYLITRIQDIDVPFDIEPTLFGLETYSGQAKKITQEYKRGTLLHLWLITHSALSGTCLNYETIEKLLTSGLDKTIKDESGKVAFDCITYRDFSNKNELLKLLYFEGIKICENNGNLRAIFQNVELPIVETFKSYIKSGINAIEAFRTQNKELLSYFISCGADINTLKEILESEESRKMEIDKDTNSSGYDDSYTEQDLRDMYRDAFDGFDDATWNID